MKKSLLKAFTIVIIIVFSTIMFVGCKEEVPDNEINKGKFEQRINVNDVTFKELMTIEGEPLGYMAIDTAIANGTDQMAAVYHLMRVAEHNYCRAENVAKIYKSDGSASASALTGKMAVRSLSIREGDKLYYQTIGRVYEATALLPIAQLALDQGKRTYTINIGSDSEVTYKQEPKSKGNPTMTDIFPFATCDFTKDSVRIIPKGVDDPNDVDTMLKYPDEITNFAIYEPGAIMTESASAVYDSEKKLYTVTFELDLSDQVKRDEYTAKPRDGLRQSAGSEDLEYLKYKVIMELWDNGLVKTYSTEESWEGTLNLAPSVKPSGSSYSFGTDYYSWDEDDCRINNYIDDSIIDLNWIPKN